MSDIPGPPEGWTQADYDDLRRAKRLVERPSLAMAIAMALGVPIETLLSRVPAKWHRQIERAADLALQKAIDVAVIGLARSGPAHEKRQKMAVLVTGAAGGSLGIMTALWELPISTCLILRSIGDIARSEGHDIQWLATRIECVKVFGLGGRRKDDDAAETGYWASRIALDKYSPAVAAKLGPFLARILSRFVATVEEELAAKAVPIVGAVGGATINLVFMNHFQAVARGHFIVLRLEKKYGGEDVKRIYDSLNI